MTLPVRVALTQTVVTLPAGTDEVVIPYNPFRKYLALTNIGTGLVTIAFDVAAVAGSGFPLGAAASAGQPGGTLIFEASAMTPQAVHAISTAGSTVVVVEGN